MPRSIGRICAALYLLVSLGVSYIALGSSIALDSPGLGDLPYFLLIGLHFVWGIVLVLSSGEHQTLSPAAIRRRFFVPELLAAGTLLFFLFSYIFATNANMDYVQRFIASGGNLRLALDTRTERLHVWYRVGPLVAVNVLVYVMLRIVRYRLLLDPSIRADLEPDRVVRPWAFVLTLVSAFVASIAMPSFLSLDGYPYLAWVALVPLFLVLRTARPGHAIFYGVTFGVFHTLLSSYWLGTFSLVSLQITVLFFLIYHLIFTPLAVHIHRVSRWAKVLVFPLAWTLLEYLRSTGFLGYPWALAAHSQYAVLPVIQIASVTGVWGVSFLVYLVNSALAELLGAAFGRFSSRGALSLSSGRWLPAPALSLRRSAWWLLGVAVAVGGVVGGWGIYLARTSPDDDVARVVRVAQVQQNNDPRKHAYEDTLQTLQRLTDESMPSNPSLIIWSETAFVPNIRRWSEDTANSRYHRLVMDMLAYQAGLETWLITGNDDYEIVPATGGGDPLRYEYNGAVLFSDTGVREQTYRKIQLVPFTESFPYRERLPRVYDLLAQFDVHFWEPGSELTVFEHPEVRFSTPICYEDVFPNYVRGFVREGAEAIFNLSNDYWSLTEVQARQHFVAGLFRAVENRRPVLRTTASGLTGQIDVQGRIIQTAPYYEEAFLVSDVRIAGNQPTTIYTRFGDFFPLAAGGMLVIIWASSVVVAVVKRRRPGQAGADKAEASTFVGDTAREVEGEPASTADLGPQAAGDTDVSAPPEVGGANGKRKRPKRRKKPNWKDIWDR